MHAGNADEMGIFPPWEHPVPRTKTVRKGTQITTLAPNSPHFSPHCSPPVRALASTIPAKKTPVPLTTARRQRGVVPFDPARAKERDADADAVILKAKKVKDWPTLEWAVDQKIEDQRQFCAWWQATVTPGQSPGRGGRKSSADRRT